MSESKYQKYIITELKAPDFGPEKTAQYAKFARRVLWMDENVCDNAFQMNVSWYLKPLDYAPVPHTGKSPTSWGRRSSSGSRTKNLF